MSCIFDWMPGCGWPLWLQYAVGMTAFFISLLAWQARKRGQK